MHYSFDHVHLISPDPERTARFYEDHLDVKRTGAWQSADGSAIIALEVSGVKLLVMEGKGRANARRDQAGSSYGLEHFGFITDDIETAVADLKKAGVEFRDEITQARPGVKYAYFWGPDNELVELVERKAV